MPLTFLRNSGVSPTLLGMALSDEIRAEIDRVEARMVDLKAQVKRATKTGQPISDELAALQLLNARLRQLETSLARAISAGE